MDGFSTCEECVDLLMDYLEGALDKDTASRLDQHLAGCAPCVNFVNTYKQSTVMINKLKEQQVTVPKEVQTRIKSFLQEEIVSLKGQARK